MNWLARPSAEPSLYAWLMARRPACRLRAPRRLPCVPGIHRSVRGFICSLCVSLASLFSLGCESKSESELMHGICPGACTGHRRRGAVCHEIVVAIDAAATVPQDQDHSGIEMPALLRSSRSAGPVCSPAVCVVFPGSEMTPHAAFKLSSKVVVIVDARFRL